VFDRVLPPGSAGGTAKICKRVCGKGTPKFSADDIPFGIFARPSACDVVNPWRSAGPQPPECPHAALRGPQARPKRDDPVHSLDPLLRTAVCHIFDFNITLCLSAKQTRDISFYI
jgi:hypothetical protein